MTATTTALRWRPTIRFGDRLRVVRHEYGRLVGDPDISQRAFAKVIGVKPGTYAGWEAPNSTTQPREMAKTCEAIARVTGCDSAWLAGLGDQAGPTGTEGQGLSPTRWYGERVVGLWERRRRPDRRKAA